MLDFLYTAVSWVLLRWHQLLTTIGMPANGGWTWTLSIALLVITARVLLFRLFIKQVHYQRNMQKMQPKIQKLREKYKDDRTELNRQMMALQQEEGFNPLTGCLPIFLQFPVFIGLYHVLRHIADSNMLCNANGTGRSSNLKLYSFSPTETCSAAQARIFNSPLAAYFHQSSSEIRALGGHPGTTRIVLIVLLLISAAATFSTQLLVKRNNTAPPAEGANALIQKYLIYLIPLGTLASGLLFKFPLGVLLYWFTSNLWTLGQQAYVIRFHPQTDDTVKPDVVRAKALAPRPGQRPVRMDKRGATASSGATDSGTSSGSSDAAATIGDADVVGAETGARSDSVDGARSTVPRPGQRPNRPAGKRPPATRPAQAKKRR